MLARGEQALRKRMARMAAPAARFVVPASIESTGKRVVAAATFPGPAAASPVAASVVAGTETSAEPASAQGEPAPALHHLTLTAFDRILQPSAVRDRTFVIALGIVLALHVVAFASAIEWGQAPELAGGERRGQVEKSKYVEVEFVEAPSETAEKKPSQQGEKVAPTPPAPDRPPQQAQQEQQEVKEAKAEPVPDKPETPKPPQQKPKDRPLSVDDFDVSMQDYAQAIERAQAQRRQHKQDEVRAHQRAEDLGAAPVGKQSAYTKATLAMLARTKPELFITRGNVYVRFELDRSGKIRWLKVLKSSNDTLLDQTIVDWLKTAKYEVPPANATPEDLLYDINFTVR